MGLLDVFLEQTEVVGMHIAEDTADGLGILGRPCRLWW